MAAVPYNQYLPFLLLLLLHLLPFPSQCQANHAAVSDADALLLIKSSFNNPDPALSSWFSSDDPNNTSHPCGTPTSPAWDGVLCYRGIVTGLRLGNFGLSGTINVDALAHFRALRSVSFVNNNLSGSLPDIGRLDALKSIYLSRNRFSGPLPDDLFASMDHLKKLWLDQNAFSGAIPSSLSNATSLLELHIEGNSFSGVIPDLNLPSLRSFNASANNLQGPIPASLARFTVSSFQNNSGLCGPPMPGPACPLTPAPASQPETKPAEPGPLPPSSKGKNGQIVLIVAGLFAAFLALVIIIAVAMKRQQVEDFDSVADRSDRVSTMDAGGATVLPVKSPPSASPGHNKQHAHGSSHKRAGSARGSGGAGAGGVGAELVMVNSEREAFGLPDLMKSAAEVLGNGSLGSAYKAVMSGGFAVAVKRMRELSRLNKEGFDVEMRRFGRLQHPNVLTPLAYHFRKEEKLIVSDYVPKGSLLYILHGDRGADHAALDWATRLKIICGIARGMSYLHAELDSYDLPHGNLKTANVLISATFDPLLADYGFAALVNSAAAPNALFAYKSPEALHFRLASPKSDVYCFGIVVLEILTGKFPSQYLNNAKGGTDVVQWAASAISERREHELVDPAITGRAPPTPEMVRMLRVGAACTQASPDDRPDMKEAAELVEEIATSAAGSDREEAFGADGRRSARGSGSGEFLGP